MMIYPTLELQNGHCVSLNKGRLNEPMVWHVDPLETVRSYAKAGAEWIHVTDFNAVAGAQPHRDLIADIIRAAGIPVQLAGGMRSREQIDYWLDQGVGRIVISTLASRDPAMVASLAKTFPDQIVLSVDVWQGKVMTEGWLKAGAMEPADFIKGFAGLPLAGIIITDIDSDMSELEAQLGLIAGLSRDATAPVIANGVVRGADDIARLKYIPGISGALVGRALFRKTLTVEDALTAARPEAEPVASFI